MLQIRDNAAFARWLRRFARTVWPERTGGRCGVWPTRLRRVQNTVKLSILASWLGRRWVAKARRDSRCRHDWRRRRSTCIRIDDRKRNSERSRDTVDCSTYTVEDVRLWAYIHFMIQQADRNCRSAENARNGNGRKQRRECARNWKCQEIRLPLPRNAR